MNNPSYVRVSRGNTPAARVLAIATAVLLSAAVLGGWAAPPPSAGPETPR